jgi:hypothetical protein
MKQIGFESARERIRKAFGRPLIDPPQPDAGNLHVRFDRRIEAPANRSPSGWRAFVVGPAVLCAAIGLAVVIGAKPNSLAAPFNATATAAAETWTDDDTTTLEDHVTGDALDARCEKLWTFLDTQIDISHMESAKPGFTAAYRSANRLGELTAHQIESQGCPLKDPAAFEAQLAAIHALNQMMQ